MPPLSRSPRILIVRLSAVGDTILTMPMLCALREKYPEAHLAWAAHAGSAALLRGHEALDDLYVVPKYWHRQWTSFTQLRRWLKMSQFDVVLDAVGKALGGRQHGFVNLPHESLTKADYR